MQEKCLEKIVVLQDDDTTEIQNFVKNLEDQYEIFNKRMNEQRKNMEFLFTNKEIKEFISFLPDCYRFESPVTLLSGDWGIGKTYFLNLLCKYVANNLYEWSSLFNRLVVIDCLDLINCDNVSKRISEKLFNEVIKPSHGVGLRFVNYLKKTIVKCTGFKNFYDGVVAPSRKIITFKILNWKKLLKQGKKII